MKTNLAVQHDQEHGLFYIKLNGSAARLSYDRPEADVMDIQSTHVPEKYRNIGIAKVLVQHSLDFARSHNKKVIPTCNYVEDFIETNSEYNALIDKN